MLPGFVSALSSVASNSIEFKNLLNLNPEETKKRLRQSVSAFASGWHAGHGKPLVFDKSRAWNRKTEVFRDISPEGVIVCIVRDLREVFASIERENLKEGLLVAAPDTIQARYNHHFSPEGVVGAPYAGVLDIISRKPSNVFLVKFETLVADPQKVFAALYKRLGVATFPHDLHRIPNTAIDPDGFYLGKFPHICGAKLEAPKTDWREVVPESIAADIMEKAKPFNEFFGYE
jgi:hypothetical protein